MKVELKVHRKRPKGWVKEVNSAGVTTNLPEFDYVEVKHTGGHATQNFSNRMIERGLREGWLSIKGDKLTIDSRPEKLHYEILRVPGRYCCICGDKLPDDPLGAAARQHMAANHDGEESPDKDWPAGYSCVNAYVCKLDADEHARWCGEHSKVWARNEARAAEGGK